MFSICRLRMCCCYYYYALYNHLHRHPSPHSCFLYLREGNEKREIVKHEMPLFIYAFNSRSMAMTSFSIDVNHRQKIYRMMFFFSGVCNLCGAPQS